MKWLVEITKIYKFKSRYWIIPCISLWYDQEFFLETGLNTPAFGLQISWLNFSWAITFQKGY